MIKYIWSILTIFKTGRIINVRNIDNRILSLVKPDKWRFNVNSIYANIETAAFDASDIW